MTRPVLVTGASGFVGSHLATALVEGGHEVRAMTRHPDTYSGAGTPVSGDVSKPETLAEALEGTRAAYYLVHSLDSENFAATDAQAARDFGKAAAAAGLDQIIYLGGLGDERHQQLSEHLRSRREVEQLLTEGGVPVTVLRAAIVIGDQGISWEITRQLVAHLPAMVAPRWVKTRTQPIALSDVVRYLVGVLDNPDAIGRTFEVGGPDVLRYGDMLRRVAWVQHRRALPVFTVPLLTPRLSAQWLALVTDVNATTARNLVDSMSNEVVVHDTSVRDVVPFEPMGYDEAVRQAGEQRAERLAREQRAEAH